VLALTTAALSLLGGVVAVRATSPTVHSVGLGTVAFTAGPALDPRVDVYVPVVDWGVRARPYRAPVSVALEIRSLDRETALEALRSGRVPDTGLGTVKEDLREVVHAGLRRAALAAILGGVLGGLVAGALLVACGRRRRWLAGGALTGLATSLAAVAVLAVGLTHGDPRGLRELTFYAHGAELPRILAASDDLLEAGDAYSDAYDRALDGVATLIASGRREVAHAGATTALVASDLHSNGLVLPALAEYSAGGPVFLAGDLTQLGSEPERSLVPGLAALGSPVVAVSGNHDSRPFMRAAARAGIVVLTRSGRLLPDGTTDGDPIFEVGGLSVAGYDDPLEAKSGDLARNVGTRDGETPGATGRFLAWFADLPTRPDVVIVHRHWLGHVLLEAVGDDGPPLLVFAGHDHRQHLHRAGQNVLLDPGTLGAGGAFGIGEHASGFIRLHLDAGSRLLAADLIEVEPLSGEGRARRVVFDVRAAEDGRAASR
jgi:predicted phosphodiesterase